MYAVERLSSYITRGVYTVSGPFHPFGGAVDIIVVQQQDGSFKSSPWNVCFGKFQGVLKTREKIVNICVNGTSAEFHMYLDHKGEAFFLKDASEDEGEPFMSPPTSGDEIDGQMKNGRLRKTQSCDYDESRRESVSQIDLENGKIVARTNSQHPRIFGLVFGRRMVKESSGGNMERVSSLERAELAADLLEVKWSTNLSTDDPKGTNSLKILSDGDSVGNTIDKEQMLAMRSSESGLVHDNEIPFHHAENSDNIESKVMSAEHIDESACHRYPDLRSFEDIIEIYSSETAKLVHENEDLSSSAKAVEFDLSFKESVIVNPIVDLYSSDNFHKFSSDKDCHLASDVPGEDNGEREVSSFFYCKTSESSNVMHDVSSTAVLEVLNSLSEGEQEKIEQPPEQNHRFEPGSFKVKEKYDECGNKNLELDKPVAIAGACQKPVATIVEYLPTDFLSSHDSPVLALQTVESETVDATEQDTLEEKIAQEDIAGTNELEISKSLYEMNGASASISYRTPRFNVDQLLLSNEETRPHSSCISTGAFNTSDKVQQPHNPLERVRFHKCGFPSEDIIMQEFNCSLLMSEVANGDALLPESMEEDHFLFNEIHSFESCEHPGWSETSDKIEAEDCESIDPEDDLGEHEPTDGSNDVHSAYMSKASKVQTSPISIPEHKRSSEEKEQWVGSLPNIRSHIHDLEMSDVQPTSHSLCIKSKTSPWGMPNKVISSFSNVSSQSEDSILQPLPMSDNAFMNYDIHRRDEQNGTPVNPAVEISLCRHLLFEGMGAEAASKAFDAEKVDFEKFAALGPSVVTNDKLVIRIGGRYFPWNAAAPVILGIVSFGREGIFDAEGMIAVDRTGKTPEEVPSNAIVPSGGAWKLWPFSFKKSRGMKAAHLASNANRTIEGSSETIAVDNKIISNNNVQKSRVIKKVRSVTPTSKQLASLNLKEGQNLVTFSFSTAMLGKQQVDARIYLWKWNTRIVISDVDGTITKSDVLGQFMPLVGKDWSQTGVAHLFSAIKENGYQLLFLSARAISQAYLTRQFLFNLKQDGKVLPDGPVVISPDGLFPSLYREVIRRAPHEFKISCLEEIRGLFPPECNPFYAGFGNRDTDEISYLKVGIPKGKIFIINPKGEVSVNHRVDTKSYTSLHALVNAMFPPTPYAEQEDFNSWNYWKVPLPEIDI